MPPRTERRPPVGVEEPARWPTTGPSARREHRRDREPETRGRAARVTGTALALLSVALLAGLVGAAAGELLTNGELNALAGASTLPIAGAASPSATAAPTTVPEPSVPPTTVAATPPVTTSRANEPEPSAAPVVVSVAALEGTAEADGDTWSAEVTVHLDSDLETPVVGAEVRGVWWGAAPGSATVVTSKNGMATFALDGLDGSWVVFTVLEVEGAGLRYRAARNEIATVTVRAP